MDTTKERFTIEREIERVLEQMNTMDIESDEYAKSVERLKVLYEARGVKSPKELSMDTIITVTANLVGILLVLNFEKLNVITSKAFTIATGRGNR